MRLKSGKIVFSPSDLIRYVSSPYSSWMDRYYLENPKAVTPDADTEDSKLIAHTGNLHEQAVLEEIKSSGENVLEIAYDAADAKKQTNNAVNEKIPIIYQASLSDERFSGFSDFIILNAAGKYEIWDTKLARSPKPYYAIQLCCYSEMFSATTGEGLPEKFGIILGTKERVEFRIEDFIHYYRQVRNSFLVMQDGFTGNFEDCPEPLPGVDHGRWASHADKFFEDTDHLVRVAGITVGQIKKLKVEGVSTLSALTKFTGSVPKLASDTLDKLIQQASLQKQTIAARAKDPNADALYEIIQQGASYSYVGLAALPPPNQGDVFFDMEGYPLVPGGLEYLFGACLMNQKSQRLEFYDWWAHDRDEEKIAFEGFVDWVFKQWRENPGMHIYHYAPYEVSAIRRLSTQHDTRQNEVDELLRHEVFVDLYQVVRQGLRIGENSYSIKKVERLYRPERSTEVANAVESIVQYAQWMESKQSKEWKDSSILKNIRDYNEDDCVSTFELFEWLRKIASNNSISPSNSAKALASSESYEEKELSPEVVARLETIESLRVQGDSVALTLADLLDFHRREEKPMWWRMFDRSDASQGELKDDSGCIQGVESDGNPVAEKQSQIQSYEFNPSQECKLAADGRTSVMFTHNIAAKFTLVSIDLEEGTLQLKIGNKALNEKFEGVFPQHGSLIPYEYVPAGSIQVALTDVGSKHLNKKLPAPVASLLERIAPADTLQAINEVTVDSGIRIASSMAGGCLVVQGPPGTGKTYTAAHVINTLVAAGKKVGVASNSHKAIINLLIECGDVARKSGQNLEGIKVGGEDGGPLFTDNPGFQYVSNNKEARDVYVTGIVGGTAWLFTLPEWEDALDFLFIDEAGQVSLANTAAMSRATKNLVLLGDQMQLEQPIQGTHPGDSGLSSLQYALKDLKASQPDTPVFHAVVPSDYGLFLGESRRMHPSVCSFISESIYEGRLGSYVDCARQKIALPVGGGSFVKKENGIIFNGIEHDGNIQKSDEEVERVKKIYDELTGREYTASDGSTKSLELDDFLFISPYNAQVRALQKALPDGARVGSVDKFQGQQAPVCILSLCSSYGEYGSRGLAFILDRNRVNVALSRAQCLAVVVADPRIASSSANSIAEMRLLNVFCKLVTQSKRNT
ncbi:hypothetical protein COB18_03980 [Candidatus Kaiserbacteria bacterium]|nr:MAG: hypothetical protein COB18_03980 [Candidatus Kaiserbacteria bacterium]